MPCNLKAYATKTEVELRYIIRDAAEAAANMHGFDDVAECKYLDQVNDATTVLARRAAVVANSPAARADFYDDPTEGPVASPHDAWYAEQAAARRAAGGR